MMPCPYCRSKKILDECTVKTYDLQDEWVAINHVRCGKCGYGYSKTIRDNLRTGRRRVVVSKGSDGSHVQSLNSRPGITDWIRSIRITGRR